MTWKHGLLLGMAVGVVVGALAMALLLAGGREGREEVPVQEPARAESVRKPPNLPPEVTEARPFRPPRGHDVAALLRQEVEASVSGLASGDASVRLQSIKDLRRLKAKEEAPRVRTLLGDPDGAVRRAAAMTAGYFNDSEAFSELARLTKEDKEPSVRAAAISSLIMTGGRKNKLTAAILADNLTSPNPHVRLAAVTAITCSTGL